MRVAVIVDKRTRATTGWDNKSILVCSTDSVVRLVDREELQQLLVRVLSYRDRAEKGLLNWSWWETTGYIAGGQFPTAYTCEHMPAMIINCAGWALPVSHKLYGIHRVRFWELQGVAVVDPPLPDEFLHPDFPLFEWLEASSL